jgi:hypothetical protein
MPIERRHELVQPAWVTVIVTDAVPVAPRLSVTVSIALYVPAAWYVWPGFASVDVPPSPKVQAWDAIVPFGSLDPAELKLTVSGAAPLVGVAEMTAVGGWLAAPATIVAMLE